jgi:hypothetical protein
MSSVRLGEDSLSDTELSARRRSAPHASTSHVPLVATTGELDSRPQRCDLVRADKVQSEERGGSVGDSANKANIAMIVGAILLSISCLVGLIGAIIACYLMVMDLGIGGALLVLIGPVFALSGIIVGAYGIWLTQRVGSS